MIITFLNGFRLMEKNCIKLLPKQTHPPSIWWSHYTVL